MFVCVSSYFPIYLLPALLNSIQMYLFYETWSDSFNWMFSFPSLIVCVCVCVCERQRERERERERECREPIHYINFFVHAYFL